MHLSRSRPWLVAQLVLGCVLITAACTLTSPSDPPQTLLVYPDFIPQGITTEVSINAANFLGGAFTVSGTGVTISGVVPDGATNVKATITVALDAAPGKRTLTWTDSGTRGTGTVTIEPALLSLSAVSPATVQVGSTTTLTFSGAFVPQSTSFEINDPDGLTIDNVTFHDHARLTARLTVAATAAAGTRRLRARTACCLSNELPITVAFPPPTITSASPDSARQGTTVLVTFSGTGFARSQILFAVSGGGVTVPSLSIGGGPSLDGLGTFLQATMIIASNAVVGGRTVTVSSAGGAATYPFTILAAVPPSPRPTIGSFIASPAKISPGGSSRLLWRDITDATRCDITPDVGPLRSCDDGGVEVTPTETTEYKLTARGPGGQEWTYVLVRVESPPPPSGNMSAARPWAPRPPAVTGWRWW